jgi:apolipoprotein D and lipocalin family protein
VHRIILIAALALAGCTAKPAGPVGFRASDVPIWSAAGFLPAQVAGQWQQAADFAADGAGCSGGQVAFQPDSQGLQLSGRLCLAGKLTDVSGLARPVGPGRLSIAGQEDWWVLWVDSGYRTMAIGTPSGAFGFVLDRDAISSDRLAAAREIFDFNGYASAALRAF